MKRIHGTKEINDPFSSASGALQPSDTMTLFNKSNLYFQSAVVRSSKLLISKRKASYMWKYLYKGKLLRIFAVLRKEIQITRIDITRP